jgi:hypothetical protein
MELFFGHAELVLLLALGLGIFAWQLESTQSIMEAVGAIACVLALLHITGVVRAPDFNFDAAKAAVVGKAQSIPCAADEQPELTGCLPVARGTTGDE